MLQARSAFRQAAFSASIAAGWRDWRIGPRAGQLDTAFASCRRWQMPLAIWIRSKLVKTDGK